MQRRSFLRLGAIGLGAALVPRTLIADSSKRLGLRGLTVDAARLVERPEYYRRLIDFCRAWNLNALLFRLTDDQGSAFRFASHPELITHEHALSPAEARSLSEYGAKRGVTVIPEVESFGHTTYITSTTRWAHLADTPPGPARGFFAISPVDPDSLKLMRDLYAEVAHAFDSPWLHGGCDEVNWGGSELSRRALQTQSRSQIWAAYLNSLEDICHGLGKQLIVWGDFVAHKEPDSLPLLNKRVVVMDWQYYETDAKPLRDIADKVLSAGLRVIGAPAVISCEWGPRAGQPTLSNITAFADAYRGLNDRALGVIVTNWMPSRYLQDSLWDTFAYAAMALNEGGETATRDAFSRFVERFYGAKWSEEWKRIFDDVYRLTPGRTCARNWNVPRLPLASATDEELRRSLTTPKVDSAPYQDLNLRVRGLVPTVRRNREAFDSFALAIEYVAHLVWREAQWKLDPAAGAIADIARRDRDLVEKLDADWSRGRFPDSRGANERLFGLTPYDQLLLQMKSAAKFSAELAADPARAQLLLAAHMVEK